MRTNSRCLRRFRRAVVASRRPDRGPVALRSNAIPGAARLLGVDAPIPTADPAPLWHVLIALGHGSLLLSGAPGGRNRHRRERPQRWRSGSAAKSVASRRPLELAADPVGDFFFWPPGMVSRKPQAQARPSRVAFNDDFVAWAPDERRRASHREPDLNAASRVRRDHQRAP